MAIARVIDMVHTKYSSKRDENQLHPCCKSAADAALAALKEAQGNALGLSSLHQEVKHRLCEHFHDPRWLWQLASSVIEVFTVDLSVAEAL
jgi:hypothetical protein